MIYGRMPARHNNLEGCDVLSRSPLAGEEVFCACVFKYPRSVPSRWVWMTWFGEPPWASRSWIPRWRWSRWRQCPWPLAACRGRTGLAVQGLPERAWSRLSRGRRTYLCPTDRKPGIGKDKNIKEQRFLFYGYSGSHFRNVLYLILESWMSFLQKVSWELAASQLT